MASLGRARNNHIGQYFDFCPRPAKSTTNIREAKSLLSYLYILYLKAARGRHKRQVSEIYANDYLLLISILII
jgi:hypothetical protein